MYKVLNIIIQQYIHRWNMSCQTESTNTALNYVVTIGSECSTLIKQLAHLTTIQWSGCVRLFVDQDICVYYKML